MRTQGTTLECFTDLTERIHPELLEKRKILASVLEVEDATVRRWMSGTSVPVGMSMIGLRWYLDYLGYEVSELIRLPKVLQDAGRLLAFRVLSLEGMAKLTGYEDYPDQVLAVLRATRGLSAEREIQFRDIVGAYQQELVEKLRTIPKLFEIKHSPAIMVGADSLLGRSTGRPAVVSPATPKKGMQREDRFKGLVLNLLDFAQFYADPEVPEEIRDQLRAVVGQRNIFDLKNLLSRLCGSKAFSNQH